MSVRCVCRDFPLSLNGNEIFQKKNNRSIFVQQLKQLDEDLFQKRFLIKYRWFNTLLHLNNKFQVAMAQQVEFHSRSIYMSAAHFLNTFLFNASRIRTLHVLKNYRRSKNLFFLLSNRFNLFAYEFTICGCNFDGAFM